MFSLSGGLHRSGSAREMHGEGKHTSYAELFFPACVTTRVYVYIWRPEADVKSPLTTFHLIY